MSRRTLGLAVLALSATALTPALSANAAPSQAGLSHRNVKVCSTAAAGEASCLSVRHDTVDENGKVTPNATPAGYGPADLRSAYKLTEPTLAPGTGPVIAIIDAYDDPTAEADLGVYRAQYGLGACTTTNGCLKKVNQTGGTKYPRTNSGWSQETSLDLDMASAICPNCKILLVEASSASFANLGAAVNYAALQPGVAAISNSYGGSDASDSSYGSYYNHPGIAVTVSSGDNGYGVEYPASSTYVTAVGGTHLVQDGSTRGWAETVWSGAGSGCSAYNAKPIWQKDAGCSKRTVADVSAVADPNTGVAVYDSTPNQGTSGWLVFGGTSVASPIIAGVYALAGNTGTGTANSIPAYHAYSNTSSLFDVTSGSNGSCGGTYLCTAGSGYDGPTGLGTPNGIGAF